MGLSSSAGSQQQSAFAAQQRAVGNKGVVVFQYPKTDPYWSQPRRFCLYPYPGNDEHDVWAALRLERKPKTDEYVRVLKSHSTPGYAVFAYAADGGAEITNWALLPDLLMLDVVAFFLEHPCCNSIYVETVDIGTDHTEESSAATDVSALHTVGYSYDTASVDDQCSMSSQSTTSASGAGAARSSASADRAADLPSYALVVHRRQLDPVTIVSIQDMQRKFFVDNNIAIPSADKFVSTFYKR